MSSFETMADDARVDAQKVKESDITKQDSASFDKEPTGVELFHLGENERGFVGQKRTDAFCEFLKVIDLKRAEFMQTTQKLELKIKLLKRKKRVIWWRLLIIYHKMGKWMQTRTTRTRKRTAFKKDVAAAKAWREALQGEFVQLQKLEEKYLDLYTSAEEVGVFNEEHFEAMKRMKRTYGMKANLFLEYTLDKQLAERIFLKAFSHGFKVEGHPKLNLPRVADLNTPPPLTPPPYPPEERPVSPYLLTAAAPVATEEFIGTPRFEVRQNNTH